MELTNHYLFWKIVHHLVEGKQYRLIHQSDEHGEVWLENTAVKQAGIVRVRLKDLDFSRWMERDMELVLQNGENLRKSLRKSKLNIKTIYVSTYPPVDDGMDTVSRGTVTVTPLVVQSARFKETLSNDSVLCEGDWELPEEIEDRDVEWMRDLALTSARRRIQAEQSLFQKGKPFFTYLFIAMQVIMFAILELNGGSHNTETLIRFGAKYRPLMLEGEWWRLITPVFLHIGMIHLLLNSVALFYLGGAVERIYGRFRFILIYLVAGVMGSLGSFLFTDTVSAGASGAIFGCFGALLYFGTIHPKIFFRTMGNNILVVFALNLVIGFILPGIDNAGHLGGVVGGFIMAGIAGVPKSDKRIRQLLFLVIMIIILSLAINREWSDDPLKMSVDHVNALAGDKLAMEKWEEAEALLKTVAEKGDPDAIVYFQLSYAEIQLNKMDQAEEHLKKAIQEDESLPEAHYNLAYLLQGEDGKREEALKHAKRAYELSDSNQKYKDLYDYLKSENQ